MGGGGINKQQLTKCLFHFDVKQSLFPNLRLTITRNLLGHTEFPNIFCGGGCGYFLEILENSVEDFKSFQRFLFYTYICNIKKKKKKKREIIAKDTRKTQKGSKLVLHP